MMRNLRDETKESDSNRQAINVLIRKLASSDPWEQVTAATYLGQVGSRAAPAVDELVRVLKGPNQYAAREAATAIGEIGPNAVRAVQPLMEAVRAHPCEDIGWFAATSLGKIADPKDPQVLSLLKENTNSADKHMKRNAKHALRTLDSRSMEQQAN